MYTIDTLNNTSYAQFIEIIGGIFEHSPWIAEKAEKAKPFSSLEHLFQEMVNIVENSSANEKLTLIKAHPNLGERVSMTTNSINEQKGAGLQDLTPDEYEKFINSNKRYMDKFGFPFILAVRGKNKQQIYEALESRINQEKDTEFQTALKEIYKIAWLRLKEKIID
ncbi:2-oxo-4-hydroxy-4-carboxy-5-ureidoimidazoline decarboxylase [Metabacillus sp. Hm71]|uniref:2-oxo-4-hydroxy-4-carboxy-5-ureidoimidazoline decarboxylase n=1 Tax=Metabacillus sp. Hm71 TaxID=3450743 RepID=UPI003F41FA87